MITITRSGVVSEEQLKTAEDVIAQEFAARGWLSDRERQRRAADREWLSDRERQRQRINELLTANNEEVAKRRAAETALLDRNEQNQALQVALTAANKQGVVDQLSINELKQANQDVTVRNSNQAMSLGYVRKERDAYCVQRNTLVEEVDQLKAHIAFLEIKKTSTVGARPDLMKDLQDQLETERRHLQTVASALVTRTAERDEANRLLSIVRPELKEFRIWAANGWRERAEAAEKLVGEQVAELDELRGKVMQVNEWNDKAAVKWEKLYTTTLAEREFLQKQVDEQTTLIVDLHKRNANQVDTILDQKVTIAHWQQVHNTEAEQILSLNNNVNVLRTERDLRLAQLETAHKKFALVEQACDTLGFKLTIKLT